MYECPRQGIHAAGTVDILHQSCWCKGYCLKLCVSCASASCAVSSGGGGGGGGGGTRSLTKKGEPIDWFGVGVDHRKPTLLVRSQSSAGGWTSVFLLVCVC